MQTRRPLGTRWFMRSCYNPSDFNLLSRSKALLPKRLTDKYTQLMQRTTACTCALLVHACASPAPRAATIVSTRNNEFVRNDCSLFIHIVDVVIQISNKYANCLNTPRFLENSEFMYETRKVKKNYLVQIIRVIMVSL